MAAAAKWIAAVVFAIVSGDVVCQESGATLRLRIDGPPDPSMVRVEYMLVGPFGGYRSQMQGSADYVDVPVAVDGQAARSLKALVFCPGYRTVRVDIPDVASQSELRIVLDDLPVRNLTGIVDFATETTPRSFVLDIDVMAYSAHEFFGIVDGSVTTFDLAEAVVSAAGQFALVLPDMTKDEALQSRGLPNVLRLRARDATTLNLVFDLAPAQIAFDDMPAESVALAASPPL
jgi:hypothetical protein